MARRELVEARGDDIHDGDVQQHEVHEEHGRSQRSGVYGERHLGEMKIKIDLLAFNIA